MSQKSIISLYWSYIFFRRKSCQCFIMLHMPLLVHPLFSCYFNSANHMHFFFFSNAGRALSSFNKMNLSVCSYSISIVKKKKGFEILIVKYGTIVTKHFAFELGIQRSFYSFCFSLKKYIAK